MKPDPAILSYSHYGYSFHDRETKQLMVYRKMIKGSYFWDHFSNKPKTYHFCFTPLRGILGARKDQSSFGEYLYISDTDLQKYVSGEWEFDPRLLSAVPKILEWTVSNYEKVLKLERTTFMLFLQITKSQEIHLKHIPTLKKIPVDYIMNFDFSSTETGYVIILYRTLIENSSYFGVSEAQVKELKGRVIRLKLQ